jgi:hypothetical protein
MRPREHDRAKLLVAFERYIAETDIPIVAEFASQQGLHRQQLYDMEELSDAIKRCITKKEAVLESKGLAGKVNTAMAIFSLKQLGWSDRQDMTLKGDAAHPLQISGTDGSL